MGARAESTAATRRSIVDAFVALFAEQHYADITLDAVAARAGVAVQTVIRHFGSKDSLFAAVAQDFSMDEAAARAASPVGDPAAVVRFVVGRYERNGTSCSRCSRRRRGSRRCSRRPTSGRAFHHDWVARVFAAAPRRPCSRRTTSASRPARRADGRLRLEAPAARPGVRQAPDRGGDDRHGRRPAERRPVMARFLAYTSPARGHLFPIVGAARAARPRPRGVLAHARRRGRRG